MYLENLNYIKQLTKPLNIVKSLSFIPTLCYRLGTRAVSRIKKDYPEYLKDINGKNGCCLKNVADIGEVRLRHNYKVFNGTGIKENPDELWLTTKTLKFNGIPDWGEIFDDEEDTLALHRWGWLLRMIVEEGYTNLPSWGLKAMLNWCSVMMGKKGHSAWEPYSASERIVNSLIFLNLAWEESKDKREELMVLLNYIAEMAEYVSKNLEYRGEKDTGNHLLNNARALYFCSRMLNIEYLSEIARRIILNQSEKSFSSSGFLREGSSHYHFLLTRSFLEIYHLAEVTKDISFCIKLRELIKSMVKNAWFFLVEDKINKKWNIPLIGDISPDFLPEWFYSLPWSSMALKHYFPESFPEPLNMKGWTNLWDDIGQSSERYSLSPSKNNISFIPYKDIGFFRLDFLRVTLFWHINTGSIYDNATFHLHNDMGSFCLFIDGVPVLIDTGRFSYKDTDLGKYGKSIRAHNSVSIDYMEPLILSRRSLYPDWYKNFEAKAYWIEGEREFEFVIQHNAYKRLGDNIVIKRRFKILKNRLNIIDNISGSTRRTVETFFHFDNNFKIEKKENTYGFKFEIKDKANDLNIFLNINSTFKNTECMIYNGYKNNSSSFISGYYSPRYGELESIDTLVVKNKGILPGINEYVITWN